MRKDAIFMGHICAGPLVRAVSAHGVAIWTEWDAPGEIVARSESVDQGQDGEVHTARVRTVEVGERYYALNVLTGLQSATWYAYSLSPDGPAHEPGEALEETTVLQEFRTLDELEAGVPFTLAYGSCRRLSASTPDALSSFADWLDSQRSERETRWPRLLLLIGDQIYADDEGHQASSFEEFARKYTAAWTGDEGVRRVLAMVPTLTIFDDHEIKNNWNILPSWQARIMREGGEQMLVDGLAAYWIYQGWGNLGLQDAATHDLLLIMQQAMQDGTDALGALRERIRQTVYQENSLQWDYILPTMPPLFVADARADRTGALEQRQAADSVPRIMSEGQMKRLHLWAAAHTDMTLVLVSSVPALLPPAIGLAEYMAGLRPPQRGPLRVLARSLAAGQETLAWHMGFEHWPAFLATWRELLALFSTRSRDLFILSGDVHFSYSISAQSVHSSGERQTTLYQFVASPFKNSLGSVETALVLAQSWLRSIRYGGLRMRMLPLTRQQPVRGARRDLLMQNVVALIRFVPNPEEAGGYTVRQTYLSGSPTLEEVGTIEIPYMSRP